MVWSMFMFAGSVGILLASHRTLPVGLFSFTVHGVVID